MTLQWITLNPDTREGLVLAPPVPPHDAGYRQALEWAALRHLMGEIKEAGGGDINLNAIYIRACEHYCAMWRVGKEPPQPEHQQHKCKTGSLVPYAAADCAYCCPALDEVEKPPSDNPT